MLAKGIPYIRRYDYGVTGLNTLLPFTKFYMYINLWKLCIFYKLMQIVYLDSSECTSFLRMRTNDHMHITTTRHNVIVRAA